VDENIVMKGNIGDLSRMVMNLLKNAADYNKPAGSIELSLSRKEGKILLVVRDTGIGMTDQEVLHIFDRFYKADSSRTQKKSSGTGLGLAIVKEIIDDHDAVIRVESSLGEGTAFFISFS
jgi:two-component system, OmpR family, phosphate regulon sensor histidine kinase PhoR